MAMAANDTMSLILFLFLILLRIELSTSLAQIERVADCATFACRVELASRSELRTDPFIPSPMREAMGIPHRVSLFAICSYEGAISANRWIDLGKAAHGRLRRPY